MNWAGNVGGFLEAFKQGVQQGLGGLLGKEGTTLDGQPLVDGKDENYMNLPWNVRKKFDESVGNQSSIFGLGGPGVDQASIFSLGGPALPGEPGRDGVPTKNPLPRLPGEPDKKIFAAQPFSFLDTFLAGNPVGDSVPIKPYQTNKGVEYMPYPYGPAQNFPRV
tara:strand:- start:15 stop:506 length:492 start_codon:yes stop_codon:yes gene_type:complete